ncbi:MAG: hypothetical protein KA210_04825 [Bacteroidia bacterium]|nr:hypothetical protein [Bacteroidia bacterium]
MKFVFLFFSTFKLFSQSSTSIDPLRDTVSKKIILKEVIVGKNSKINALKLGVLSSPPKKYTLQERRYYSSTSGPISLLINSLNGNVKTLKKNIEVEKKIKSLTDLSNLINNSFYVDVLKISEEDILSFKYFIIEDSIFRQEINLKKLNVIKFKMIELSFKFKQLHWNAPIK